MASGAPPDTDFFEKRRDEIELGSPSGCWLWAAYTNRDGYGRVWARGKNRLAHREAYEAVHGAGCADGLVVRHRCDTPACVNPDHLVLGTHADNVRDKMDRGRSVTPDRKGEANGRSKLTEAHVRAILLEYVPRNGMHGQRALARRHGVAKSLIGMIVNREIWTHVA